MTVSEETKDNIENLMRYKEGRLCSECIDYFDIAKKGYQFKINQTHPYKILLNLHFCSKQCYESAMENKTFDQLINAHLKNIKIKIWFLHPVKCTCEICTIENM